MYRSLLISGVLMVASTAFAFDVTTCNQTVPAHETGILQADLTCPVGIGVHVGEKAVLDLNGHAIVAPEGAAIACEGRQCNITSTGASVGDVSGSPNADCITMEPRGRMVLSNLHVHDCRTCIETNILGAHAYGASLFATGVTVDGCTGPGIDVRRVKANGISVTHAHEIALWAEMMLRGTDIDVSDNGGIGIFAVSMTASNVVANNNGMYGVETYGLMRINGGTMLGNGIDVVAKRARFTDVTCGQSKALGAMPPQSLGVCTND